MGFLLFSPQLTALSYKLFLSIAKIGLRVFPGYTLFKQPRCQGSNVKNGLKVKQLAK